jgi:hypothetical protein
MASISFDNGSGTQTITQGSDENRFNRWHPLPSTAGEEARALGDGYFYQWIHRSDYAVSFEMPNVSNDQEAVVQQLLEWANSGGEFTLTTDDSESNEYTECQVAPRTRLEISDPDPATLEFTIRGTALNVSLTHIRMRCVY